MRASLEQFLESVARRGSWVGGGSAAALSGALSAALLEKLLLQPSSVKRLRTIRRECLRLIDEDALTFARVIEATRAKRADAFANALKRATDVPCRVAEHAAAVQASCRAARRLIKPRFQSDLRCAQALARAAEQSAWALIQTNLAWLKDRSYSRSVRRRLARSRRAHGR